MASKGQEPGAGTKLLVHVDARADGSQACGNTNERLKDVSVVEVASVVPVLTQDDTESGEGGISFDDALTRYVGEFGKGQMAIYTFACLLQVPNAVLILLMVFSVGSPILDKAWTCTADAAADPTCAAVLANPTNDDFCALAPSQWAWTDPNHKVVSRFNLVCGNAWKSQLANSFFFVGYLIGSGLSGVVADAYGRKGITFGTTCWGAVFTAAALGATNYWVLLVLRLLTGIGVAGQALGSFMLSTEMLGPTWRGIAGILTQVFFIMGEFVLVVIAVVFPSWRGQFAAGSIFCAASIALWPLIPESGRWLYVQGRTTEAVECLANIARRNGSRPLGEPLAAVHHVSKPPAAGSTEPGTAAAATPEKLSLRTALKNFHIARRFFILCYVWMVLCMVYYGISFALGSLGGSLVMSFCIAAIAELPSYLLAAWAIERWGRHNTMASGMLLGGVACIACAATPVGAGRAALAAVGKFGIAGSFGIASVYTSELFPTLIRSAVLGYQNQAARVGGIIAPFIVMAGAASQGGGNLIPFATFGAAALLAGLLIFTLPETLGVPLPDTLQDMDNIASVFTHKTWQTGGFKAATKSMFKTKVMLKKPAAKASVPLLPAVQEGCAQQQSRSMAQDDEATHQGQLSSKTTANHGSSSSSPSNSRKNLLTGDASDLPAGLELQ